MTRRPTRLTLAMAALAAFGSAHPMGNFSVSHYARIEVQGSGVAKVTYVLDLAELPTYELLQKWDLKQDSPFVQIEAKATAEAKGWVANLKFRVDGKPATARILDTKIVMASGAGNLPISRVTSHLEVPLATVGALDYEDGNYPDRAGWKEIVIGAAKGVTLIEASQIDSERSKALTVYPTDPTIAPPQDLRARVEWKMNAVAVSQAAAKPTIVGIEQPKKVEVASTPAAAVPLEVGQRPTAPAPGEVVKGDALSQLLSKGDLGTSAIIIGLITAFWFGCIHATSPGHGKTMVAAYLVGERGTPKHAIFLGAMVTFTHTVSVFALGLATYFLAGRFAPESVTRFLSILSGVSIIAVGLWLLYKRSMKLMTATAPAPAARPHAHQHDHDHDHHHHHDDHGHVHDHQRVHAHAHAHAPVLQLVVPHKHDHGHDHGHTHDHPHHDHGHDHHHHEAHEHDHDHGPGGHSHVPEGPVTIGSLVALGASGGMVPCPSALVLLLGSVSVGRIGFGLALLTSFSLGLASVLMAIGLAVLYAKHLLPKTEKTMKHPLVKLIPVLSAGAVTVIGVAMTAIAFGWIKVAGV